MVLVQNICQKWKEHDEISKNVNFEATDIWLRDFTVILMLKKLIEIYTWTAAAGWHLQRAYNNYCLPLGVILRVILLTTGTIIFSY